VCDWLYICMAGTGAWRARLHSAGSLTRRFPHVHLLAAHVLPARSYTCEFAYLTRAGGACGYGTLVDVVPMKARVGAVSPVLFKNGEGCGACYKVRCLDSSICSRRAVTVIVTDECPGGVCSGGRTHFDLSGAAFGLLAVAGSGGQLRNRGEINVVFHR
jgi:hypothetical protein